MHLLGVPIDLLTMKQTVALAVDAARAGRFLHHGALNAAKLVNLQHDEVLRQAVAGCDVITADGQAVVWAGRFLGIPVPERVAGIDLMERLLTAADEHALRVFLLGAERSVVEAVARLVASRFPNAILAGMADGYFDRGAEAAVVAEIRAARPQLLFVALQSPEKELFLARHRAAFGACFAMGVGGTFDVLAGRHRRAPRFFQRLGLEWLFRLAQEPRRLLRRYAVGNTAFVALVLRERFRKIRGGGDTPA